MRTQQSYSGYYNGTWIRSSYEYALIKYFEHSNTQYEYEPFLLNFKDGTSYLPDFLVDGVLYEVKNEASVPEGHEKLSKAQLEFGIQGMVVTYAVLKHWYSSTDLNLNRTIKEWKERADTKLNNSMSGNRNPRYGVTMSDSTKELIRAKAKERMTDPAYRRLMWERSWSKAGSTAKKHLTGRQKVLRVKITCPNCGVQFSAPPYKLTTYCSRKCSNIVSSQLGVAAEIQNMELRLAQVREVVTKWVAANLGVLANAKYNNVRPVLQPLFDTCHIEVGCKDYRTIAKAFNATNAKGLLKELKILAENVRRASGE